MQRNKKVVKQKIDLFETLCQALLIQDVIEEKNSEHKMLSPLPLKKSLKTVPFLIVTSHSKFLFFSDFIVNIEKY